MDSEKNHSRKISISFKRFAWHGNPECTARGLKTIKNTIESIAEAEQLPAHKNSAAIRFAVTCDSVIFDMDGVLVDVSKSYRFAIKKTVEYVLLKKYRKSLIVSEQDIIEMKKIPGFNNDWDLSYELVRLLSQGIAREKFKSCAMRVKRENNEDYKQVKDVFQSFYLGEKTFREIYKREPPVKFTCGLILKETALIDINVLKNICDQFPIGIATSRPRFEALYTLKKLNITPNIIPEKYIVAQEDVKNEKPFPDALLEAKKRLGSKLPVYVGDSINDIIAAKKAGMSYIFVGKNKQADIEISDVNKIEQLLCYN